MEFEAGAFRIDTLDDLCAARMLDDFDTSQTPRTFLSKMARKANPYLWWSKTQLTNISCNKRFLFADF
jgi:hypothetical protein